MNKNYCKLQTNFFKREARLAALKNSEQVYSGYARSLTISIFYEMNVNRWNIFTYEFHTNINKVKFLGILFYEYKSDDAVILSYAVAKNVHYKFCWICEIWI